METRDKSIDAYIMRSPDFAQPILEHLRELVHKACPQVEETMKWSMPHFMHKGILCAMAAFKHHCAIHFWKVSIMSDPDKIMNVGGKNVMGRLGRIASTDDLPSDKIIIKYIKEAVRLNNENVKIPSRNSKLNTSNILVVPDYFLKALKKDKKLFTTFNSFTYSNRKEYIEWIAEAKTDTTRTRRLNKAIELIAEGKIRNGKQVK